jgi:hypothetical protein
MNKWCLVGAAVVLAVGRAAAGEAPRSPRERAVEGGLAFLVKAQEKDGGWRGGVRRTSVGVSGLAVLALLSAGDVPGKGPRGEAVEKGLRWLLSQQRPTGVISPGALHEMYDHGIATLALASAHDVCQGKLKEDVRKALDRAVAVILKAQRKGAPLERGGWRYQVTAVSGSDLSVTGWQVLALAAARREGCAVPQEAVDAALDFIRRCQDGRTGGLRYMPPGRATVTCTATGLLGLCLLAKDGRRDPVAVKAADFLFDKAHRPRWGDRYFSDSVFHGSQAAAQVGGAAAEAYLRDLRELLLAKQKEDGAWPAAGLDSQFGTAFSTALAVLALTAEDRRLPVFRAAGGRKDRRPPDAPAPSPAR